MSEDDPIAGISQAQLEAIKAGDVDALMKDLEDDVVFMPPADMTLYGRQEVEEWWRDYFEYFSIVNIENTERSVGVVGDCAVERTAYSVKLVPKKGGAPIYDDARFLDVWRRQSDGSWKLWQRIWNSVKPIGAGTNRFLVRFIQRREE